MRYLRVSFGLMLPCVLWLAGCNDQKDTFNPMLEENKNLPIVAQVGDQVIFDSDVDAELQHMPGSLQQLAQTPEVRKRVEDILIRRAVLSQQAEAQGLDLKPDVFASIREARDNILIDALKAQHMSDMPIPDQATLQAYYDSHRSDFTIPEQIHAAHILLRNKEDADRVYAVLKDHPDQFAKLAVKESLDDSNNTRGGDLNWFPRGAMAESFEAVAFAMEKEGDISEPVETDSGWHIIQLKGRKPASLESLADAQEEIIHILQHQELEQWINDLVSKANVKRKKKTFNGNIELPLGLQTSPRSDRKTVDPTNAPPVSAMDNRTADDAPSLLQDDYAETQ